MEQPPRWIDIVESAKAAPTAADLDVGERDAIWLAGERKADLLLMDDREGVEEAVRHGLTVTGTLGVLVRAAEKGWVGLPAVFSKLRNTNSRASPALIGFLLEYDSRRRAT